jgi:hypothetical protein
LQKVKKEVKHTIFVAIRCVRFIIVGEKLSAVFFYRQNLKREQIFFYRPQVGVLTPAVGR